MKSPPVQSVTACVEAAKCPYAHASAQAKRMAEGGWWRILGAVSILSAVVCMPHLPRPSIVPKRFDVKRDRRGVGNWGLQHDQ
jgi:hypothetical protein